MTAPRADKFRDEPTLARLEKAVKYFVENFSGRVPERAYTRLLEAYLLFFEAGLMCGALLAFGILRDRSKCVTTTQKEANPLVLRAPAVTSGRTSCDVVDGRDLAICSPHK